MYGRLAAVLGLIGLCLALLPGSLWGVPAGGLIVAVSGEVVVHRGGHEEAVSEGFVLQEGDTVIARPGSKVSGFTPEGEPFELAGPAELKLAAADRGFVGDVASWVQLQLAEWIGESRRQPLTTRNIRDWVITTEAPAPLVPAPEGKIRGSKSSFYWTSVPGVRGYVVTIAPAMGEEMTHVVRDNSVVVHDLVPGEQYVWKVQPDADGWEASGRWRGFTVMTPDEEKQLDEALRGLEDLEAGVLLLSAGLHEEAIYHFDVAVASPNGARSAHLWRAKALADIGLYEQAYDDLVEARGFE